MPGYIPEGTRTTKLGVAALVLGIISIPLFFVVHPGAAGVDLRPDRSPRSKRSNGTITGRGLARAGWILGTISLLGFAALIALVATGVIETDDVAVTDLEVGQCVDLDAADDDEIFSLPKVACEEPHDGEVYFVADIGAVR